jgi:formylglycine-generating enzyme required for sulfatase activity
MRTITRVMLAVLLGAGLSVAGLEAAEERPTERVSPAPHGNPNAVIWRTPAPPANPQKCDIWVDPASGMEMVYIAPGEFTMGTSDAEVQAWLEAHPESDYQMFRGQQPRCKVKLKGFWIGRTEVTNAQYRRFIAATNRSAPEHWLGGEPPAGLENYPVVYVEWEDAKAYCEWAGGRLPSEPEWEKAARGGDGRAYPWGVQWDARRCRCFELLSGRAYADAEAAVSEWMGAHDEMREGPAAVGSYPTGASPFGCLDMAGNVLEWCADWYYDQAYERYAQGDLRPPAASPFGLRAARGGSFEQGYSTMFRCSCRYAYDPGAREINIGFRCARDAAR